MDTAIDFDDRDITIESESGQNGINVGAGVSATFSNGTITMNKSNGSSYPVVKADKAEITLDNMTIELTAETGNCISAGSDGGKVIIKGTTVKGPNTTYSNAVFSGSKSTLELANATIIGGIRLETNAGLIIKGGDFTQATFYFGGGTDGEHPRIIYAGTFAVNPKTIGSNVKVDANSTVTDNGNGTWTVTAG